MNPHSQPAQAARMGRKAEPRSASEGQAGQQLTLFVASTTSDSARTPCWRAEPGNEAGIESDFHRAASAIRRTPPDSMPVCTRSNPHTNPHRKHPRPARYAQYNAWRRAFGASTPKL